MTSKIMFKVMIPSPSKMTPKIILGVGFLLLEPQHVHAQEVFDLKSTARVNSASTQERQKRQKTQPPKLLPTLPLLEQYRGEAKRGVRYLSESERLGARLRIKDGTLLDARGLPLNPVTTPPVQPLTRFPDQPESAKQTRALGFAIYVMNTHGELFVSFDAERHTFHHSSLLAGGRVASAGEMIIFNGTLYAINNRSGHYRPPPIALQRTLRTLEARGVKLKRVLVKSFGTDF